MLRLSGKGKTPLYFILPEKKKGNTENGRLYPMFSYDRGARHIAREKGHINPLHEKTRQKRKAITKLEKLFQ